MQKIRYDVVVRLMLLFSQLLRHQPSNLCIPHDALCALHAHDVLINNKLSKSNFYEVNDVLWPEKNDRIPDCYAGQYVEQLNYRSIWIQWEEKYSFEQMRNREENQNLGTQVPWYFSWVGFIVC